MVCTVWYAMLASLIKVFTHQQCYLEAVFARVLS